MKDCESYSKAMETGKLDQSFLPEYDQIPDVGLYLDQVVKYLNGYLDSYPELSVTGSMISNYVKLKLVPKAVKKAYSRDQIAMFFMIVLAKQVLSIDEIRKALVISAQYCNTENAYTRFRQELLAVLNGSENPVTSSHEERQLLHLIVLSIAHKMELSRWFAERKEKVL